MKENLKTGTLGRSLCLQSPTLGAPPSSPEPRDQQECPAGMAGRGPQRPASPRGAGAGSVRVLLHLVPTATPPSGPHPFINVTTCSWKAQAQGLLRQGCPAWLPLNPESSGDQERKVFVIKGTI